MSALHPTRRRLLGGIVSGVTAALAGCTSESSDRTVIEDERHDPLSGPPPEATTDFEVRSLRAPTREPFVRFGSEEPERPRRRSRRFVLDDEEAATLEFDGEHPDADAVRSFVDATDYERASVAVHQRPIDACYTRRVEYVTARPDRYYVQFCRELKDATTACAADEREMEALFIRVPHAYDGSPSSSGSGEGSQCRSDHWIDEDDA